MAVAICADAVVVLQLRGRPVEQGETMPSTTVGGARGWGGGLQNLDAWLADGQGRGSLVRRERRVQATVSAAFTRLCSVPWTERRLSPEQDLAWVRLQFENAYGDMRGWTVQVEPGSFGCARVACAMPTDLVTRWHALCRTRRLGGGRLQPHALTAWNRWRQLVRPGQLWAVAEADRVVWALRGQRAWDSVGVASQRASVDALPQLAQREQRLRGAGPDCQLVVHAPGLASPPVGGGEGMLWLSAGAGREPTGVAMARALTAA